MARQLSHGDWIHTGSLRVTGRRDLEINEDLIEFEREGVDKAEAAHVEDAVFMDDLFVVAPAETGFEIAQSRTHPIRRRLDRLFFKLGPDLFRTRRRGDGDLIHQPNRGGHNMALLNLIPF